MKVLFSLGSNLSWDDANLKMREVRARLSTLCPEIRFSTVYPTKGVGRHVGAYANCMAEGETDLSLVEMEHTCKQIELTLGRTAEARRLGVVPIDIDIVRYGTTIVRPKNYEYEYMTPGLKELGL